ncbi:peptide chain release factor N(5)-glutamine methyltransferase [Pseudooceanicola sp. MF1-13]|uniref:peptide chain release factor N(5)-glutamine methyltransferase n=1 Tax=Pseudooceanicola sp. MF1-13 TaxID=3379095 RepID=UPI003892CC14
MTLRPAIAALEQAGVPDPAGDARRLFDWAYARGQEADLPQDRDTPNDITLEHFEAALHLRIARKPVSQIIGSRAFWRHDFVVTGDVLDPRPDTETLVEQALMEPFSRLLDLGTGSGCIAISLLADRPEAQGEAVDLSDKALAIAQVNADQIGVSDRLRLYPSDWFDKVSGTFDLIVSNPPYIAQSEMAGLAPEVRDHEPAMALSDGGDGLACYRVIADGAVAHLSPGGRLMVEIGPTQSAAVSDLFVSAGLVNVVTFRDIDGRDRVVAARKPQ